MCTGFVVKRRVRGEAYDAAPNSVARALAASVYSAGCSQPAVARLRIEPQQWRVIQPVDSRRGRRSHTALVVRLSLFLRQNFVFLSLSLVYFCVWLLRISYRGLLSLVLLGGVVCVCFFLPPGASTAVRRDLAHFCGSRMPCYYYSVGVNN